MALHSLRTLKLAIVCIMFGLNTLNLFNVLIVINLDMAKINVLPIKQCVGNVGHVITSVMIVMK